MSLHITAPIFDGPALCAEVGGDEWYPETGGEGKLMVIAARRICQSCEIQAACLTWALANDEPHGLWGGLTPAERSRLKRHRKVRPISHGTVGGYRTHQRRGELPCESCSEARRVSRQQSRAA